MIGARLFAPGSIASPSWGDFPSLQALAGAGLHGGRFSVRIDGGRFEAWLRMQPGTHLWVLLSAARTDTRGALPKFDRWSWASRFPGPVLCVSDPTLFLDERRLRIGWYLGTAAHDWQRALAELVRAVAARLALPTRRVISYGSSAGGFASLMLAARLGDATAVAINPQTDVLRYSRAFVDDLLGLAFDGRTPPQLSEGELERLSALRLYRRSPEVRCLYVQNRLDAGHLQRHFLPFARALGLPTDGGTDPSGHLQALLYDDDRGHAPEPPSMAPTLIEHALRLAAAELAPRPPVPPPLEVDWTPLDRPYAAAQAGLHEAPARRRRPAVNATSDDTADPGWRCLDDVLLACLAGADVRPLRRRLRAAAYGTDAAWAPAWVASRARRLALLLSLQRAGQGVWPASRLGEVEERFDAHLRALVAALDDRAASPSPELLLAAAALASHLRGAAARADLLQRCRAAVERSLAHTLEAAGRRRSHSPEPRQQLLRRWQACAGSGWFDGTGLGAALARAREPRSVAQGVPRAAPAAAPPAVGDLLQALAAHRPAPPMADDVLSALCREVLCSAGEAAADDDGAAPAVVVDSRVAAGRVHLSLRRLGPAGAWQQLRHVVYAPGAWLLMVDVLRSDAPRRWTRWLHFGPQVQPTADPSRWRLGAGRPLGLHVKAAGGNAPELECVPADPPPGWRFGHRVAGRRRVLATLLVADDSGSSVELVDSRSLVMVVARGDAPLRLALAWSARHCRVVPAAPPAPARGAA